MSQVSSLSDQDLYNQVSAVSLNAPQAAKDLIDEVVQRWHAAYTAVQQGVTAAQQLPPAPATTGPGTLQGSNIRLEKPEKFDGDATKLANWTFNVHQFCQVAGVTQAEEIVKMAVTLLTGKALTWWRSVALEGWAQLGQCTWQTFCHHLESEFRDLHHALRFQTRLFDLRQRSSVAAYNEQFRAIMLEVRNLMSPQDLLLAYLRGLKAEVQRHVLIGNPADVGHAMTLADSADSAMWFQGSWQRSLQQVPNRPQQQHRRQQHAQNNNNSGYAPMELGAATSVGKEVGFRGKCYLCGEAGHMKRDCPKAKGKQQQKNA